MILTVSNNILGHILELKCLIELLWRVIYFISYKDRERRRSASEEIKAILSGTYMLYLTVQVGTLHLFYVSQ